ncbi:MAG: hypothetical protein Fur0025_36960 [Oscillatoriaceae cyanobacterium]
MNTHVTAIAIKATENPQQLELLLQVDDEKYNYPIAVFDAAGILGIACPGELQMLLANNPQKSQYFIQTILQFYQGATVDLPLDLGDF